MDFCKDVLYRDPYLIVVNKPSGLAVHRGWARDRVVAMTLVRDFVGRYVYPVHRLDRGSSGALLLALDASTAPRLHQLFEMGRVQKRYLALVRGVVPEEGVIDRPIPAHEGGPRMPAVTTFRRLHVFERYSVVEAVPHHGRLHQIRRHFKHISHPLIGDVQYGKGEHNRYFRATFGLHRLALHAVELSLPHPATGEMLSVHAPVPADLGGVLAAIGMGV